MSEPHELRREYEREGLRRRDMPDEPIGPFTRWFEQAREADIREPNAMTLATCGADGLPRARIVLLKEFDADGFIFYTSHLSDKANELKDNPQAALCFWWDVLERSVRITGPVTRVERERSERYFSGRPRASQIGAWASVQSRPVESRDVLAERLAALNRQYEGEARVPSPPFWGGYRVRPRTVEFWQGRPSRLHDRFRYTRRPDHTWQLTRLSP